MGKIKQKEFIRVMKQNRVVITGVGCVTPLGNNVDTTWENLKKGVSGVGELTKQDKEQFPVKVAAELKDFDIEQYIPRKDARKMDPFTHYAIAASIMAVEDANLSITDENATSIGVWIGSGIGGMTTFEQQHSAFLEKGVKRVSPFFIPMMIPDMASGQVSILLGAKGINSCSVTACSSGAHSIGDAFRAIQRGDATAMITGGAEAPITEMGLAGFCASKALSFNPDPKTASRPFDKNRDGFVIGEGAGILVLEELEHAKARGANIYAEVVGYGATGDGFHITSPAPEGEGGQRAMKASLADAGISPTEIDYINTHGTSTPVGDACESMAIKQTFGGHANNVSISSTKSMTGHLLGASGAVEAIFSIKAIQEGVIPPTINYETPDEECDLSYTPNQAVKRDVTHVLSNSLGFGGHNASLVFKKYTHEGEN